MSVPVGTMAGQYEVKTRYNHNYDQLKGSCEQYEEHLVLFRTTAVGIVSLKESAPFFVFKTPCYEAAMDLCFALNNARLERLADGK